ncbi:MAG TPA: hypothetical protein VJ902_03070 [Wenzhouxiangellaceae bacterium]|nr:hypothetical protein [Wenzhouxiangellaceae bacterium]
MKTATPVIAAALAAVILGACTDNSGDTPENNVLEGQHQALERARDVEKDVAEAARRQAEEIERSEGGG